MRPAGSGAAPGSRAGESIARDVQCVELLQWALPRLRLRWAGFRKVRRRVCRRLARRLHELDLPDFGAYRRHLESHPTEWSVLDALCRITISRFYRDRAVFDALGEVVLPALARDAADRGESELLCWSAGCGCGEEAYTLCLVWELGSLRGRSALRLRVVATDVDESVLARARRGRFAPSSLRDLPARWRDEAFSARGSERELAPRFRAPVELRRQDLRETLPEERFHLILCRNLAFTYFDEALQRETLRRLLGRLRPGGALVIGMHEALPDGAGLAPWLPALGIHRRVERRPR